MASSNRAAQRAAMARQQHSRDEFLWRQDQRRAEQMHRDLMRDSDAADAEREKTSERVRVIMSKAQADAERAAGEVAKRFGAEERRLLGQPVTRYTGATRGLDGGLVVWHWRAAPSPALAARLGVTRNDAGPLVVLKPGGGLVAGDSAPDVFVGLDPSLLDSADFMDWAGTVAELWHGDVQGRYGILARLRDDDWWARTAESAGISDSQTKTETLAGRYGPVDRKVTTTSIPSISAVEVTQDGLEIEFAHRPGDAATKWAKGLDSLRAGFSAQGMNAAHLRVSDGDGGSIILSFNDAPAAFPEAIAPPPVVAPATVADAIKAYPTLRWSFGVDARGNEISARLEKSPHIALIAETGGGKSVMAATLLESLRPFASCWIFDGKGSDHPKTLGDLAGISWISKSPAEHIVGTRWLWDEMNERYAEADQRKARGQAGIAFAFPPIFVLIDELPSLRGQVAKADTRDKGELFDFYVNDLLQKGRQARIHLCLVSQSLRVDAVPGWWQENLSQIVFLGPVSSRSMMSDAIPESVREQVASMSARIPADAKGRGIYLSRGEGGTKPVLFQSYWGYAPGTTSLDMAPTEDVRASWEVSKETAETLPRLYDRVGIKVDGPEWRDRPMAELSETPTVVVADEHGPVQGMAQYDPLGNSFLGAVAVASNPNRARGRGAVSTKTASEPKVTVTPPASAAADITATTDDERREAVRREAIRLGLIPDDESVDDAEQDENSEENNMPKRPSANGYSL
ncbi:cell division protein FtsK [Mycobacteroides abscessus subsp. abscessus]|uniref:cell division protein FtsK n=1 Tax=Mycobacteroides abscessus TaxID=36809 RepID=UPI0009D273DE|nr:cell division protein FtsK [Mycobacteroides abscessus]QSM94334.1 cell division protein FtsK [Mycobacteroides abscessus subsp. abscessus]QSM99368.1 cell division protein FtsK [Mycobacteroides abscessus subsp. abscessus]SLJ14925.1 FtsK/SpoIIIE family protein [Mycobacteroides abscessus subsp. abscessus]